MAVADKFKQQQLLRTQQLIRDINFDNAIELPSAAGAEGANIPSPARPSSSWIVNRVQDSIQKNDMTLIGASLRDITDILNYRQKITGEKNPLYNFFENLRNRAERGEHVTWQEFTNAINTFSADQNNLEVLQDEINNAGLALEEGEKTEAEAEEPSNITPFPQDEGKPEEELPIEQPHEEPGSGTAPIPPRRQPPPPEPQVLRNPYKKTEEEQKDLKKRMEKSQRPESEVERPKNALPERRNPAISSKTRKEVIPKIARTIRTVPVATKLGAASPSSGGLLGALNNYLGLRDLVRGAQWAAGKLGQGWLSNAFGKLLLPEQWLGQALRGLANIGAQLGRQLLSSLAQGAANVLSRLALQAGLSAARVILMGILANPIPWFILAFVSMVMFVNWYGNQIINSECDKPGRGMSVQKSMLNVGGIGPEERHIENRKRIDYKIEVRYDRACASRKLESVEVTDKLPAEVDYVDKSGRFIIFQPSEAGEAAYDESTRTLTWNFKNISEGEPAILNYSVIANEKADDSWVANQASVKYTVSGGFSDITGLLPSPLTPSPANWADVKSQIIAAFNKHPELLDIYKQASSQSGIPWQVLAGIHFVEKAGGPGPDSSLVSGRIIGQVEPDINPNICERGIIGPGIPIPISGGCGFSNQTDSAIYAANHLITKINKVPTTFPEVVEALSMYNGGGNANCGEGLPYGPCPPQFKGEDDPYAMADFDEAHSNDKMYIIFCGDKTKCTPKVFGRPGVMGVVRALIEEGF